jgi:hypothetical protein
MASELMVLMQGCQSACLGLPLRLWGGLLPKWVVVLNVVPVLTEFAPPLLIGFLPSSLAVMLLLSIEIVDVSVFCLAMIIEPRFVSVPMRMLVIVPLGLSRRIALQLRQATVSKAGAPVGLVSRPHRDPVPPASRAPIADAASCVILVSEDDLSQGQFAAGTLTIQPVDFDRGRGLISVV